VASNNLESSFFITVNSSQWATASLKEQKQSTNSQGGEILHIYQIGGSRENTDKAIKVKVDGLEVATGAYEKTVNYNAQPQLLC
jgi:hypothetical protein